MAIYSILPSTNLRYQDIRDTLNANGGTVGNTSADANSIWSANAKINMWSRWKPVRLNQISALTDEDLKGVNFGIIFGDYNYGTPKEAAQVLVTYGLPRGGNSEPLRPGDFRNYSPNAKPPLEGLTNKVFYSNVQSNFTIAYFASTGTDYEIGIAEFPAIGDMYLCVAVYNTTMDTLIVYKTENSKLNVGNARQITFDRNDLGLYANSSQTLKYVVCAATNKYTDTSQPIPFNSFRPLPFSALAVRDLIINTGSGLSFDAIGINNTISVIYDDINQYLDFYMEPEYYQIDSTGNLNLVFTIEASVNITYIMNLFTLGASKNFVGSSFTGDIPVNVYDISGSSPVLVTGYKDVLAGNTYKWLLNVPNFMKYTNGLQVAAPMTHANKNILFSIKYNNNQIHQSPPVNIKY